MGKNKEKNDRVRKQNKHYKHSQPNGGSNSYVHTPFKINKFAMKYLEDQGFITDRSYTWEKCFPNLCYVEDYGSEY